MKYTWHVIDDQGNRVTLDGRKTIIVATLNNTEEEIFRERCGFVATPFYECGGLEMVGDIVVPVLEDNPEEEEGGE